MCIIVLYVATILRSSIGTSVRVSTIIDGTSGGIALSAPCQKFFEWFRFMHPPCLSNSIYFLLGRLGIVICESTIGVCTGVGTITIACDGSVVIIRNRRPRMNWSHVRLPVARWGTSVEGAIVMKHLSYAGDIESVDNISMLRALLAGALVLLFFS